MHAFGLSKDMCMEFLRKQCTIASLSEGKWIFIREFYFYCVKCRSREDAEGQFGRSLCDGSDVNGHIMAISTVGNPTSAFHFGLLSPWDLMIKNNNPNDSALT
jgi:hypothetical protein